MHISPIEAKYFDKRKRDTPRGFPGLKSPRKVPTPHEVVKSLFTILDNDSGNRKLVSNLHMTFGQFLAHDISLTPNAGGCTRPQCGSNNDFRYPCFPIKFSSKPSSPGCTKFTRSFASCPKGRRGKREQVNVLSSYIDASMVYGVTQEKLDTLLADDNSGTLKIRSDGLLQIDASASNSCRNRGGCFLAGEARADEHIGLASFHTLFAREHNRIAKKLKKINPHWKKNKIFQTTRKIVGAIIQHITYKEYIPTLVELDRYRGYRKGVNAGVINAFSTAANRFGHSQVKNSWGQLDANFEQISPNIPLQETFFDNSVLINKGIEPTMLGLVGNQSEEVDLNFATGVGKKLFKKPNEPGIASLMAINIQRGRDHGLPGYNEYRKICRGIRKAKNFDGFRGEIRSKTIRRKLEKLYGNVNNHIDLFVAGVAEKPVSGKLVGKTFGCIIKKQYERLRDGDSFFYKRRGIFSRKHLNEIKKTSMAKVLCDNLHGVVSMQQNVFKAFEAGSTRRRECSQLPGINLKKWEKKSRRADQYADQGEYNFDRKTNNDRRNDDIDRHNDDESDDNDEDFDIDDAVKSVDETDDHPFENDDTDFAKEFASDNNNDIKDEESDDDDDSESEYNDDNLYNDYDKPMDMDIENILKMKLNK